MVAKVEIFIENSPTLVCYAGKTMSGMVEVTVEKPVLVQGLLIKIEGAACCKFRGSTCTDKFLETTYYLINSLSTIKPGIHSYRFECVIPTVYPTSIEETVGSIRYFASVTMELGHKSNITKKIAFQVIRPIDLNEEFLNLRSPRKMEISSPFFCFFGSSKSMIMTTTLPMTGFVAGQNILISTYISNPNNLQIHYVEMKLIKILELQSDIPMSSIDRYSKVVKKEICKSLFGKYTRLFTIPDVPPSTLKKCRIIDVSYEIHVKAKISGFHLNPTIKIPVVIGTVPYIDSYTLPDRSDLPPSYDEAMKSKKSI